MDNKKKWYKNKFLTMFIFGFIGFSLMTMYMSSGDETVKMQKITYSKFLDLIENKSIKEIELSNYDTEAVITLKNGNQYKFERYYADDSFIYDLKDQKVSIIIPEKKEVSILSKALGFFLTSIFPLLILFAFLLYMYRGSINKLGDMSDSYIQDVNGVKFEDVAGIDEVKSDMLELLDYLKNPAEYEKDGIKMPKGIIFHGPSGNGKTLLAKALANEAGVKFFSAGGSEFVEMIAGRGALKVRKLFEQASKEKFSIIFIDEIDAVGKKRSLSLNSNEEREQTLNQLLICMDGFKSNNVIVIAATNRLEILDEALLRPGRFDKHLYIGMPDISAREQLFKLYLKDKNVSSNIDIKTLAKMTIGFSGAEIANLVNQANHAKRKKNKKEIDMEILHEVRDTLVLGKEKKIELTEKDKKIIAYHEVGHAVIGLLRCEGYTIDKITMIPRDKSLGVTLQIADNDKYLHTEKELHSQICMSLGGRAAEDIFMGYITTGSSGDLDAATKIARSMIVNYGYMHTNKKETNSLGLMSFNSLDEMSSTAKLETEKFINEILSVEYNNALQLLQDNKELVEMLVKDLEEKETLHREDIYKIYKNYRNW